MRPPPATQSMAAQQLHAFNVYESTQDVQNAHIQEQVAANLGGSVRPPKLEHQSYYSAAEQLHIHSQASKVSPHGHFDAHSPESEAIESLSRLEILQRGQHFSADDLITIMESRNAAAGKSQCHAKMPLGFLTVGDPFERANGVLPLLKLVAAPQAGCGKGAAMKWSVTHVERTAWLRAVISGIVDPRSAIRERVRADEDTMESLCDIGNPLKQVCHDWPKQGHLVYEHLEHEVGKPPEEETSKVAHEFHNPEHGVESAGEEEEEESAEEDDLAKLQADALPPSRSGKEAGCEGASAGDTTDCCAHPTDAMTESLFLLNEGTLYGFLAKSKTTKGDCVGISIKQQGTLDDTLSQRRRQRIDDERLRTAGDAGVDEGELRAMLDRAESAEETCAVRLSLDSSSDDVACQMYAADSDTVSAWKHEYDTAIFGATAGTSRCFDDLHQFACAAPEARLGFGSGAMAPLTVRSHYFASQSRASGMRDKEDRGFLVAQFRDGHWTLAAADANTALGGSIPGVLPAGLDSSATENNRVGTFPVYFVPMSPFVVQRLVEPSSISMRHRAAPTGNLDRPTLSSSSCFEWMDDIRLAEYDSRFLREWERTLFEYRVPALSNLLSAQRKSDERFTTDNPLGTSPQWDPLHRVRCRGQSAEQLLAHMVHEQYLHVQEGENGMVTPGRRFHDASEEERALPVHVTRRQWLQLVATAMRRAQVAAASATVLMDQQERHDLKEERSESTVEERTTERSERSGEEALPSSERSERSPARRTEKAQSHCKWYQIGCKFHERKLKRRRRHAE
ncbi:MAG: hypothetical protein MHM6MM_001797 [Cercozoa sp. M6MM]